MKKAKEEKIYPSIFESGQYAIGKHGEIRRKFKKPFSKKERRKLQKMDKLK